MSGNNQAVKTIPHLTGLGHPERLISSTTTNILSCRSAWGKPVHSDLPVVYFFLLPPPPDCSQWFICKTALLSSGVSCYSAKRRLSAAGDERGEAETQRQIKATKTRAIVPLLRVTNRRVKATQRGWNALASIPFSAPPPPSPFPPLFIFIRFIIGHKGLPTKQLVILVEFIPFWGLQGN